MPQLPDEGEAVVLGGPGAADKLAKQAPTFQPLVERFGPARVRQGGEPFAALANAIANQQMSVQAGATIYGRLEAKLGGQVTPKGVLDLGTEEIRSCGFSRPKTGYLQDLSTQVIEGNLPLADLDGYEDDEVVDVLTQVKGIGPWTAQMVLIFDLHRQDILATGDLGIQDGVRLLFDLEERPSPSTLENLAEPWRPYRSLACWYVWMERDRLVR